MVFNYTYRIGLEDCGRENKATNKAILTILENIAGLHSATVGLGLNEISETGCAWVVLNWQMQIIKRPEYNDELKCLWNTEQEATVAAQEYKKYHPESEPKVVTVWSKDEDGIYYDDLEDVYTYGNIKQNTC